MFTKQTNGWATNVVPDGPPQIQSLQPNNNSFSPLFLQGSGMMQTTSRNALCLGWKFFSTKCLQTHYTPLIFTVIVMKVPLSAFPRWRITIQRDEMTFSNQHRASIGSWFPLSCLTFYLSTRHLPLSAHYVQGMGPGIGIQRWKCYSLYSAQETDRGGPQQKEQPARRWAPFETFIKPRLPSAHPHQPSCHSTRKASDSSHPTS